MKPQSTLSLTRHAAARLQQQGIKISTLDLLERFGRRVYSHDGAIFLVFDRDARRRIQSAFGKAAPQLRLNAYAVVDATRCDTVITVGHQTSRKLAKSTGQSS